MTDTATQTGVDKAEVVVGNIQRNETMERLAEAARKERDRELEEAGFEVVDTLNVEEPVPEELKPEETKPEETKAEPEVKPEEPETPETPETPVEKMVKVKVDGKEMEVPESQVLDAGIRAVQKESAADKRLAEATQLLKTAQEAAAPKKTPLPDMDEVELSKRIRMGTDEEAQEAIRILQGRDKATPDEIAAAVEGRVLKQIEFKDAVTWFQSEYKEIVADPHLVNIAIAEEARLRSEGDERPYKEVYKDVGEIIRKKLQDWKGGKPTVSTSTEKRERKAEITNLPAASARQQAPEQPKPKSPSQIIQEMREARGQK